MRTYPLTTLIAILSVFLLNSCEKENWNLVDPPAGRDSVLVRYMNFCGDGAARTLSLDGTLSTESVADYNASATLAPTSDSAFVSVRGSGSELLSISGRMHFSRQSNELLISVPSLATAEKKRSLDTVLHLTTLRTLLAQNNYSALRMIVCSDDSDAVNYEMHVGCPNGTMLGSPTPVRQSTAFAIVPSGAFVVSILRNGEVVGIYNLQLNSRYYYSVVIGRQKGIATVRLLDEFSMQSSCLSTPPTVQAADRQASIRTVNYGSVTVDSVVSLSGIRIASNLGARSVGSYTQITTCSSDIPDQFQVYSSGQPHQMVSSSLGVLARYTLVSFDSTGVPGAGMVLVAPPSTQTTSDSVSIRVVNTIQSPTNIHLRLGLRSDASGALHNGEVMATSTAFGAVSALRRVYAGTAPITVLSDSSNNPEALLGSFLMNLVGGKEYIFIVGPGANGSATLSVIESSEESTSVNDLPAGIFTQVVNARSDRADITCSIGGVFNAAGISFGRGVSTVVPQGQHDFQSTSISRGLSFDSIYRMTIVVCGNSAAPDVVVIDTVGMKPEQANAKSRYLNVSQDQPSVIFGINDASDTTRPVIDYFDNVRYGQVSPTKVEELPTRVNFATLVNYSRQLLFNPGYPLTFSVGKAYTLIFCGSAADGYAFIVQQEY